MLLGIRKVQISSICGVKTIVTASDAVLPSRNPVRGTQAEREAIVQEARGKTAL